MEEEWKRRVEAQLGEKHAAEQMAHMAEAESSKRVTCEFAQAALAYWRSQGTALVNQP